MRVTEYNLHDVQVLRIEQHKKASGGSWLSVTVEHRDGVTSELIFWPVGDDNIAIEFGDK